MRECSVVTIWHKTRFFLPRPGVRVLGLWPEGDMHLCEKSYADDSWLDSDVDCELIAPEWWMAVVPPKEEE